MDLRHQRDVPVRQPMDQVHLPQRSRAVERPREDPRDLLGQLAVGRRRRQRQLAHVVLEVEVRIVDPIWVVQAERHLLQPQRNGGSSGSRSASMFCSRPARVARSPECSGRAARRPRRARIAAVSPAPGTAHRVRSAAASLLLGGESIPWGRVPCRRRRARVWPESPRARGRGRGADRGESLGADPIEEAGLIAIARGPGNDHRREPRRGLERVRPPGAVAQSVDEAGVERVSGTGRVGD